MRTWKLGTRCPRCDSNSPELHPAVQHEGEVSPCSHSFHELLRPCDPGYKIAYFQDCHKKWLNKNFPHQTPEFPAAGCLEEAGELMHALLKCQQWNVWGAEERYKDKKWREELEDAIGDCAIFACSLCNTNNWDFADALATATYNAAVIPGTTAFESVAELVQCSVDVVRQPKVQGALHAYLKQLASVCQQFGMDLEHCIEVTWNKVQKRNRT